jgi:hypothetical protein
MKYLLTLLLVLGGCTTTKTNVTKIDYRYEVRHQDHLVNDLIYTSYSLKDSEEYVNEDKASHSDLYIYDLKTGDLVGVSTP